MGGVRTVNRVKPVKAWEEVKASLATSLSTTPNALVVLLLLLVLERRPCAIEDE